VRGAIRRILFTSSRRYTDRAELEGELRRWAAPGVTLVHGAAPGGDTLADRIWRSWELPVERHPAQWSRYRNRYGKNPAGPIRNRAMVSAGADICLAMPLPGSTGTWDCARAALEAGIPVWILGKGW
jgi:hypothetical protein